MLQRAKRIAWPYWSQARRSWNKARMRLRGGFHNGRGIVRYRDGARGNHLIKELIAADAPLMIARYGDIELKAIWSFLSSAPPEEQKRRVDALHRSAGFFPPDLENLSRFVEIYEHAARRLDCLAIWNFEQGRWEMEERMFRDYSPGASLVSIRSLESWLFADPWTASLRGRKVLVIHPFEESIRRQYAKRAWLFVDELVLPEFGRIDTLKAVQSIAGNPTEFATWFDALESMRAQIADRDFDVALIGAGAYGFPLAAFVKDLGKKAVHMGGVTQILFGIIGSRWEKVIPGGYPPLTRFVNANWTRPLPEETPDRFETVDGGAYW